MTLAEFERLVDSKRRVRKREAEEKAQFDYILGDLIGRSMSRLYSSSATYPPIYDVYPTIFNKEEMEAKKHEHNMELSVTKFKQFAESFNKRFKKEGDDD